MYSRLDYFKEHEFKCKCGICDLDVVMDRRLLVALDRMRKRFGKPIIVNSGIRCPDHNRSEGGVKNSSHLSGKAADIRVKTDRDRFKLIGLAIEYGIPRIGIGLGYLHLDVDTSKNYPRVWIE